MQETIRETIPDRIQIWRSTYSLLRKLVTFTNELVRKIHCQVWTPGDHPQMRSPSPRGPCLPRQAGVRLEVDMEAFSDGQRPLCPPSQDSK